MNHQPTLHQVVAFDHEDTGYWIACVCGWTSFTSTLKWQVWDLYGKHKNDGSHSPRLAYSASATSVHTWYGTCTCGWSDVGRTSWHVAMNAADSHIKTVQVAQPKADAPKQAKARTVTDA